MVEVALSLTEVEMAAKEGTQRRIRSMFGNRQFPGGWDSKRRNDKWGSDIESVAGEIAFAKAMGYYWAGSHDPDYHGDVRGWQVRTTDLPNGCLFVYDEDPDDRRCVLVIGQIPFFKVVGWVYAGEAKGGTYDPRLERPAYSVAQHGLRSLDYAAVAA
jgi:hypothetical protein